MDPCECFNFMTKKDGKNYLILRSGTTLEKKIPSMTKKSFHQLPPDALVNIEITLASELRNGLMDRHVEGSWRLICNPTHSASVPRNNILNR